MKKSKKALLTAAILTAAVNFTSCGPDPDVQTVYGPPSDISDSSCETTTTYEPEYDKPQPEYDAPVDYKE